MGKHVHVDDDEIAGKSQHTIIKFAIERNMDNNQTQGVIGLKPEKFEQQPLPNEPENDQIGEEQQQSMPQQAQRVGGKTQEKVKLQPLLHKFAKGKTGKESQQSIPHQTQMVVNQQHEKVEQKPSPNESAKNQIGKEQQQSTQQQTQRVVGEQKEKATLKPLPNVNKIAGKQQENAEQESLQNESEVKQTQKEQHQLISHQTQNVVIEQHEKVKHMPQPNEQEIIDKQQEKKPSPNESEKKQIREEQHQSIPQQTQRAEGKQDEKVKQQPLPNEYESASEQQEKSEQLPFPNESEKKQIENEQQHSIPQQTQRVAKKEKEKVKQQSLPNESENDKIGEEQQQSVPQKTQRATSKQQERVEQQSPPSEYEDKRIEKEKQQSIPQQTQRVIGKRQEKVEQLPLPNEYEKNQIGKEQQQSVPQQPPRVVGKQHEKVKQQPVPNGYEKKHIVKEQQQSISQQRRRRQGQGQRQEYLLQVKDQKKQKANEESNKLKNKKTARAQSKRGKVKKRQPPADREKNIGFLYDTRESHPIIEYLPSKEEADSVSLTPSFVLEVTWPRIVQFYHSASPRCLALQSIYVELARAIKRRSSRLPVEFHAVNCGMYRQVCEQGFNVKSVPTIIGLRSGRIEGMEIIMPGSMGTGAAGSKQERNEDVELKVEHIAQVMGIPLDIVKGNVGSAFARPMGVDVDSVIDINADAENFAENKLPGEDSIESSVPLADQVVHDAKSSLLATLTSSLYSQFPHGSALPPDTSKALESFLDLIRWAFPPETQVHNLAEDLKLDYVSVSTSEQGLLKVVERHMYMGSKVAWSQRCGAQATGGYSCGLWTLLHILSIGVAERHTSVVGDAERVSVTHAGKVMRTFIEKFFIGCDTCKESWIQLYDEACCGLHSNDHFTVDLGAGKSDDWRNLAIWIWEVHNKVTVLRQKSAGRSIHHRQSGMVPSASVWPSKKDCPKCWQSLTDDTGLAMNMDSFDREELYNHLKKTYWPSGVHNNRLIILDRWSKAKRALSRKRLRIRMAAHDWPISVLALHIFAAYLVCRIAFPGCSIHMIWRLLRRATYRSFPARKRKKKIKMPDPSYEPDPSYHDERHPSYHDERHSSYHDQTPWPPRYSENSEGYSDHYARDTFSTAPRLRKSTHASEHMAPNRGGSISEGFQYSSGSHGRRRRYAGSGYHQSQKYSFDHFLEL